MLFVIETKSGAHWLVRHATKGAARRAWERLVDADEAEPAHLIRRLNYPGEARELREYGNADPNA